MSLSHWFKRLRREDWQREVRVPDGPNTPPIRRRYRFSGRVQGVGFRFQAMQYAVQLGLTGWARNETDGSVTVEIQGAESYIDVFVRAMREFPWFDIKKMRVEDLPVDGTETKFRVLY